jgi:pSer/pThr/pTyr-binding forkhead associated (FHA) protein
MALYLIYLTVIEGPDKGLSVKLERREVVIGRGKECDLLLTDAHVSRKHARIYREGEVYYLQDLESKNGTYLNGVKVGFGEKPLLSGDKIKIGENILIFEER